MEMKSVRCCTIDVALDLYCDDRTFCPWLEYNVYSSCLEHYVSSSSSDE